ncbi:MAG: hypothetical protein GVY10_11315 [Verrucomicrobia bacterium]|jgi:hypothetical protein|nr:hypothetical protein [Verrucomicrobiota bacterium]
MDLQRFFDHWNLSENPFQAEEARNDAVYARTMEGAITHPDFQKIYGSPDNPSTSIVFGEKGSGKTAMRLLIERRLTAHNNNRAGEKVWIVRYDDLNPVLDRLVHRIGGKDPARCLEQLRLQDHQDAILSLAVTRLVDDIVEESGDKEQKSLRKALRRMSRERRLDLGVLSVLYDQPRHGQRAERWKRLKGYLRLGHLATRRVHALLVLAFGLAALGALGLWRFTESLSWEWQLAGGAAVVGFAGLGIGWLVRGWKKYFRARRIHREVRSVEHDRAILREALWDLPEDQGTLHLIPDHEDQDKRYEATQRFLRLLEPLGYKSLVVLVDRVDEPALINSDAQRMRSLVWPMLNNKFLQQERVGIKMLLPIELGQLLETETSDFQRQARLDKQNLVNPLRWTGATLYDLCTSRFRNCQREEGGERIEELKELFEEEVEHRDLVDALDQMHQPRDAFKFLYAVILRHCQNTPGEAEKYKIPRLTLDYVRQEQSQRVMNLYRGVNQG